MNIYQYKMSEEIKDKRENMLKKFKPYTWRQGI